MAITGTHTLLYSSEPEKLRETLRDVFALPGIDIGHGPTKNAGACMSSSACRATAT